jgi:beta-phosphoglucomutase family hydrolase
MESSTPVLVSHTPRAVIWDVDGTLIDSGALHFAAWSDILADEQFTLTREQFQASFGQRNDAVLRSFLGAELGDDAIMRIGMAKEERYRDLLRTEGIKLLPGVGRWLDRLKADGWRQALASSAPHANLDAILDVLALRPYFDAVVSGDDVVHGKPDPEIFLRAAALLDVEPRRCVVVEDAPAGIEGARCARMHSVGVRFAHPDLAADIVVASMEELPADAFDRLVPAAHEPA